MGGSHPPSLKLCCDLNTTIKLGKEEKVVSIVTKKDKISQETLPAKYRIYPDKKGRKYLAKCFGGARFLHNWFLAAQDEYFTKVNAYVKEFHSSHLLTFKRDTEENQKLYALEFAKLRKNLELPASKGIEFIKEIIPEISEEEIQKLVINHKDKTLANKSLASIALKRQIKILRKEFPWLAELPSEGLHHVAINLGTAWSDFFNKKTDDIGKPRYKKKFDKQTFKFDTATLDIEKGRITFPKLKKEQKVKVHRVIDGEAKSTTVELTKTGKYYIAINYRQDTEFPSPTLEVEEKNTVGIDLGIGEDYAILSNEKIIKNPKFFRKMLKKKRRLDKAMSRKEHRSQNWIKAKKKCDKLAEEIANCRDDFQHKLSNDIVSDEAFDLIVMEDLGIKQMAAKKKAVKNEKGHYKKNGQKLKKLQNRAVLDSGLGGFVQKIEYKSKRQGKNFVKVDRYFPSSKTCSSCGYINQKLTLDQKEWDCPECKTHHERNINASRTLRKEGVRIHKEESKKKDVSSKKTLKKKKIKILRKESNKQQNKEKKTW